MRCHLVMAVLFGLRVAVWCGLPVVAGGGRCTAQTTAEVRIEAEIMVPPVQRLEVDPSLLTWPVPTAVDLAARHLDPSEPITVTVRSNTSWELAVRGLDLEPAAAIRAANGEASGVRILWRTGSRAFASLGEDWAVVASGVAAAEGTQVRLHLRIPLSWSETRPGVYEPRIEYRLSPVAW